MSFTEGFDEAYQALHLTRGTLKEKLYQFGGDCKKDRMALKLLISKIDDQKPMNACGYFSIEKSTLTSILSIRYFGKVLVMKY